jgi:signal transduction histidine kinase
MNPIRITAGILLILFYCSQSDAFQSAHPPQFHKVLILFSAEGWTAPANRLIYDIIKNDLNQALAGIVNVFPENLDITLFPGDRHKQRLVDLVSSKYNAENIDLIVTVGPFALSFVTDNRNSLLPGIPIIFNLFPETELHRIDRSLNITGVATTDNIVDTIRLIQSLHPGLKNLAVIAGTAVSDRYTLSLTRQAFENCGPSLNWLDTTGLSMHDLLLQVSGLPESTAILFLSLRKDSTGKIFLSSEAQQLLSEAANCPLYNLWDTSLEYGSVGGKMIQVEAIAKMTAGLAIRVLSGENAAAIDPVILYESQPMFNWRELKRWNIDPARLPAGSVIRFREYTFWDTYKWWIIGTICFIGVQTALIATLMINLTHRRKMEEELAQIRNEMAHVNRVSILGEISQNLAHEINQPLTAILVNAEAGLKMLSSESWDMEEIRDTLRDIISDSNRARDVIQRIRRLIKKEDVPHTQIEMNDVIQKAVKLIQEDAKKRKLEILNIPDSHIPSVMGDDVQLQQVILNLLINAMESFDSEPVMPLTITIKTARGNSGQVIISVSDTGTGIDPEISHRLFVPFFTTKPQGLGLGLSISKHIIEAHGGTLTVGADVPHGTTVTISLPSALPTTQAV